MKNVSLRYDPNLSIEDNAKKCGVTVHAIRKYIQTNGIDRRHDAQLAKYLAVQKVKAQKPNATVREISEELGLSENTVRKYLRPENEPTKN
jgi:predicted transcriptional regulator